MNQTSLKLLRIALIPFVISLSACGSLQSFNRGAVENQDQTVDASAADTAAKQKITYGDFDQEKDTLYDLLVAEIAAQRDQFNVTLLNYIQQARLTKDPDIIKRAINAAQYSKDVEAIMEMGKLWAQVEPNSVSAHQLLAFQHSIQKQYVDAMLHIDKLIELGGEARVDSLALGAQQLPEEDKNLLLELYQNLHAKYPNNRDVTYSLALMYRNLKNFQATLDTLEPLVKSHPDFQPAALLRANTLYEAGEIDKARDYAEEKYADFPENHTLGRLYASLLIENKQLDKAEDVFEDLMERYPQAPGFKLSFALVMLENGKEEASAKQLNELIAQQAHENEAHFYLARIADKNEDPDAAIAHYQQVKQGTHFESALERSSFLLSQQDKLDEALSRLEELRQEQPGMAHKLWVMQYKLLSALDEKERAKETLNQAIDAFPDDEQLRYARAMTYESEDKLDEMEQDLRYLMRLNPENAIAINALGYTLADRTDRLQEALGMIAHALQLKPENPAILDSMGWVLYRLGKTEEAVVFLLKAFQSYPDPEVAAHLGEVLWQLGKPEDAQTIWSQVLKNNPEHKVLLRTIKRFAPAILEAPEPDAQPSDKSKETSTEPAESSASES